MTNDLVAKFIEICQQKQNEYKTLRIQALCFDEKNRLATAETAIDEIIALTKEKFK